ncbi:S-adenosyl-L-methionine-dependent methyltransferase [Mariannaea sp. PMI_226]|nr:S-adenosyl-L-methionine-dependent methyltransferase [Mariannaea sp. PMI_226]
MPAPLRLASVTLRRLGRSSKQLILPTTASYQASGHTISGAAATRPSALQWHSTSSQSSSSNFSSVNPDEVAHFNALAAEWWEPHGSSRLLHLMNPLRHDFIRECQRTQVDAPPSSGLTYLDIGCGGGIFAESAARLPSTRKVTAIDPTPEVLAVAKAHARKDPGLRNKLQYLQTSVEQLPVPATPEEAYDIVSMFEVIEHVDEPGAVLERVRPFVKPGGWLVMSTIARTWVSWFTTNFMAEDVLGIVPKGTHDWNKYLNEDELRRFLEGQGWSNPMVQGVVYIPGLGWKEVEGSEKVGNYFFAVRKVE